MTTDSQGISGRVSNISTARGFERMQAEEAHEWPPELQDKGQRALIALKMMVGQEEQFTQSQAIRRLRLT